MSQITPGEIRKETVFKIKVEDGSELILKLPEESADEIIEWAIVEGITPEQLLSQIIVKAVGNPRNPYSPLNPYIAILGHGGLGQVQGILFPIQGAKKKRSH
jgi:hypothetical protein